MKNFSKEYKMKCLATDFLQKRLLELVKKKNNDKFDFFVKNKYYKIERCMNRYWKQI